MIIRGALMVIRVRKKIRLIRGFLPCGLYGFPLLTTDGTSLAFLMFPFTACIGGLAFCCQLLATGFIVIDFLPFATGFL